MNHRKSQETRAKPHGTCHESCAQHFVHHSQLHLPMVARHYHPWEQSSSSVSHNSHGFPALDQRDVVLALRITPKLCPVPEITAEPHRRIMIMERRQFRMLLCWPSDRSAGAVMIAR
jgi:hypothetical protein